MKRRALCIGINEYAGTGSDLAGCVNDANDWAAVLARRDFDCELLVDQAATRDAIVAKLEEHVAGMSMFDRLVVTYSGHGSWVTDSSGDEFDGRDECWVAADLQPIIDDDLADIISRRPLFARVLVVSDSCHSGSVLRVAAGFPATMVTPVPRFMPANLVNPSVDPDVEVEPVRALTGGPKALLMSGCKDDEYSYDAWFGGRPNGAFTRTALDGLYLPWPASYAAWMKRIHDVLPSARYPQTPRLRGTWRMRNLWGVL